MPEVSETAETAVNIARSRCTGILTTLSAIRVGNISVSQNNQDNLDNRLSYRKQFLYQDKAFHYIL